MSKLWMIWACTAVLLVASHPLQAEEGLLLHYAFDEGAGEVVRDKSGHGHDGKIVRSPGSAGKAEWVQEKNRKVLRLDGNTYIEAGTKANAMMGQRGTLETWCLPEEIGGGLISWHSGPNWPDQRLVLGFFTYRDSRLIGVLANGVESTPSSRFLYLVEKGKWTHLAMTFGDREPPSINLFVNGECVCTIPQIVSPDLKDVPLRVGRNVGLGGANFLGRMAEVRIYNRALSADEVGRHFTAGVQRLGIEIPRYVGLVRRLDAKRGELTVLCDLARVPTLAGSPSLSVVLRDARHNLLQEKDAPIPAKGGVVPVTFSTASLTAGLYEVSAAVKDAETKKVLVEPATLRWYLPEVAQLVGAPPGRKILNNLVTQLAAVDNLALKEYQEVPFVNPRKGWVFLSTTVEAGNRGLISVSVDAEKKDAVVVHRADEKPTMETMRLLGAGEHKLRIWAESEGGRKLPTISRLVIRAVPAMMYCGWPGSSYVAGYGEYDFKFLARDVLPNINTLVGQPGDRWDPDRDEWKKRGGQSLQELPIPTRTIRSILKDVPVPLTGEYAYNYWAQCGGFTKSNMDGAINDEFGGGDSPDFHGYIEGVKRIAANPAFKDKGLHMWGGPVMALPSLSTEFVRTVIDAGYKMAWEDYLVEPPTVEEALALFDSDIRGDMGQWEKAFPGFPRHAIIVLFVSSAPPENANINPGVDYKVFLDMQYHHLATSPECMGLWGVMIYKATYADEEVLRWAGRLFRHYCIEGNTDLLSDRYGYTYNLRHVRNPDFDEGLTGWQAAAAETGSVTTGHMPGLHGLLSRYHGKDEGSNFLLMKRSAKKPNRVSQEIVGLQAGRYYSMKILAADHQDLVQAKSEKKRMTVSVNIENAETIAGKSFVSDVKGYQPVAQYLGKEPPWMNYHRLIFRAKGPTARLTISDWADPSTGSPRRRSGQAGQATPGGPIGQETLMNFIEIQSYLED